MGLFDNVGAGDLDMQPEGYLKAPPSNLRALVKTTVLAGMFSPVENVSVANSTCSIKSDQTEQLQSHWVALTSMLISYVLLLGLPAIKVSYTLNPKNCEMVCVLCSFQGACGSDELPHDNEFGIM